MSINIDRHCLFDRANRLTIRRGDDGDLALQAYRMGEEYHDYKMHRDNPTLRTLQGGGRYVDYFKDGSWKRDTSLYRMTTALFRDTRKELVTPSFLRPLQKLQMEPDTQVELLQFPSDDGGNELGFRLIRHTDHVGMSTFHTRHDSDNSIVVWLGHARLDPFFETLWDTGVDTVAYNRDYNNHKHFRHEKVTYGELMTP